MMIVHNQGLFYYWDSVFHCRIDEQIVKALHNRAWIDAEEIAQRIGRAPTKVHKRLWQMLFRRWAVHLQMSRNNIDNRELWAILSLTPPFQEQA